LEIFVSDSARVLSINLISQKFDLTRSYRARDKLRRVGGIDTERKDTIRYLNNPPACIQAHAHEAAIILFLLLASSNPSDS
jgi:hypothetical protein